MSNLWFNIRFGTRHWTWGPDGMEWQVNPYHVEAKSNDPKNWKWFAIYTIFGKHY